MERGLTRNQIIAELTRSPHGDLKQYVPIAREAVTQDADFLLGKSVWF